MAEDEDLWSQWLKKRRFGGDKNYQELALAHLKTLALQVIKYANIFYDNTVLDIGAGDGLLGFVALEKLGKDGKLIFSDFSESALSIPIEIIKKNPDPRVHFAVNKAEDLSSITSNSIDRVLMRAVLLYIEQKQNVFDEIFRVLKPGGIAVLSEPINQRHLEFGKNLFKGYPLDSTLLIKIKPLLLKIIEYLKGYTPTTFYNYTEHDLIHASIHSGFTEINLEYSLIRTSQSKHVSWDAFFNVSPNPHAISLKEAMENILTKDEFNLVERTLKKVIKKLHIRTICNAVIILKKLP